MFMFNSTEHEIRNDHYYHSPQFNDFTLQFLSSKPAIFYTKSYKYLDEQKKCHANLG